MLEHARSEHPDLTLQVGDLRSFRLGRTFDCITCIGSVLMYALTNADLQLAMETFRVHAHTGTLLILELNKLDMLPWPPHFRREVRACD